MAFIDDADRVFLEAVSDLAYANPFLPERIDAERRALGPDFDAGDPVWSLRVDMPDAPAVNPTRITERLDALLTRLRGRVGEAGAGDRALYDEAAQYWLFTRHADALVDSLVTPDAEGPVPWYDDFVADWRMVFGDRRLPVTHQPPHLFALFFQIARGFHFIFRNIVGGSPATARLRAAVWQSLFTHDMRRYRDRLCGCLTDVSTLITGPSGTGKELVARAVGLSQFIAFDPKTRTFRGKLSDAFHALNLSALSPTLIESELFGHRKGAFTGALADRRGWLESCPATGAVFLDEIGDLDVQIQIKLLRVLQTREFQPVGDLAVRRFEGKIIAATNRDLSRAMREYTFREDFYYRLCADLIETPSLRDQLRESPGVLRELVTFIAQQVGGDEAEVLAEEAEAWIVANLGIDYAWPGNIRELEQCVRSILLRKEYRPRRVAPAPGRDAFVEAVRHGTLTADQLLSRYCTLCYVETGSYQETARRLGLDRRTVKAKVDWTFASELGAGRPRKPET